jgi:GT2 family glycosyltransferase
MHKVPSVKIITLNWNGLQDTREFLLSLKKISYTDYSVDVIDNNSSNDDGEKLKCEFGGYINVVELKKNLGFAGGNNYGIRKTLEDDSKYILLINNDTVVEPDFLDILINEIEADSKIGMISPIIYFYSDPGNIWSAGGKISWLRSSGFAKGYLPKHSDRIRRTDFISGCCMLIRRKVIEDIGLFDESFFLYLEDADLCYRAKKKGYKIMTVSNSKIYHKVGNASKETNSLIPLYFTTRNRLYFAKKHFPKTYFIQFLYLFITLFFKNIWWNITGKQQLAKVTRKSFSDYFNGKMGNRPLTIND